MKRGTLSDKSAVAFYRYKIIKEVGDGTFGSVWRAINKQTGEVVCFYNFFGMYYCEVSVLDFLTIKFWLYFLLNNLRSQLKK
jgi:serine/threonine protein kinase